MAIPPRVKITANTSAKVIDILPVGSGLFMVLCIKASVVFSIIWLNALKLQPLEILLDSIGGVLDNGWFLLLTGTLRRRRKQHSETSQLS